MKYINTKEHKQDERLLRTLLKANVSNREAEAVLQHIFSDLVKWTLEDVIIHLTQVFNFTPIEVDLLIERYPAHIPTVREIMRRSAALPVFTQNSERVKEFTENLWKARKTLNDGKKLLSKTPIYREDYENQEDYDFASAERLNVNAAFVDINRWIDSQLENAHSFIQGKG